MANCFDDSKFISDKLIEIRDYRTESGDDRYILSEAADHIDSMYNYVRRMERKLIRLQDKLINQIGK